jgi:hypothetical protein
MFIDDNPNEANFVCQLVHTLKIRQKSCTLININAKFLDQVCDSEMKLIQKSFSLPNPTHF